MRITSFALFAAMLFGLAGCKEDNSDAIAENTKATAERLAVLSKQVDALKASVDSLKPSIDALKPAIEASEKSSAIVVPHATCSTEACAALICKGLGFARAKVYESHPYHNNVGHYLAIGGTDEFPDLTAKIYRFYYIACSNADPK
jgi:outer membrane murein-binding lipoprotein Lpp